MTRTPWVDFGYELTMEDVSMAEVGRIEGERPEREEGWYSEADVWDVACWRINQEIEVLDQLVQEEDDAWIGRVRKLREWITLWE